MPLLAQKLPILIIGYNRPELIKTALDKYQTFPVSKIYIAIDGPRDDSDKTDVYICRRIVNTYAAKKSIIEKLFVDKNYGCRSFPEKAITWFFSNETIGIVLEDDIQLSRAFISFANVCLKHPRISIAASCTYPEYEPKIKRFDYVVTRIPSIWGWATTSRTWFDYMNVQSDLPKRLPIMIYEMAPKIGLVKALLFGLCLRMIHRGDLDAWDYLFAYHLIRNNMLTAFPTERLSCNVGFGENATHNKNAHNPTLPFTDSNKIYSLDVIELRINTEYQAHQALNTPFYPEFRMHILKGCIRYILDLMIDAAHSCIKSLLNLSYELNKIVTKRPEQS
jgi:hypothetical protein